LSEDEKEIFSASWMYEIIRRQSIIAFPNHKGNRLRSIFRADPVCADGENRRKKKYYNSMLFFGNQQSILHPDKNQFPF